MDHIRKKLMLKGAATGVLTIEGGETADVRLEWLRGSVEGPVILFAAPAVYRTVRDGRADIAVKSVVAAAVGEKLTVRGQLVPFDWQRALAGVHMDAYFKQSAGAGEKPPARPETHAAAPPPAAAREPAPAPQGTETASQEAEAAQEEVFVCPVKKQPREIRVFSTLFPDSVWYEHEYESTGSTRRYLTGMIYEGGRAVKTAAAVPGSLSPKPPPWLKGSALFAVGEDRQGYWILLSAAETGKE